jgi:hemerythrin-like domain-containing protein/quercetin dioxygenase-like cupin family protein
MPSLSKDPGCCRILWDDHRQVEHSLTTLDQLIASGQFDQEIYDAFDALCRDLVWHFHAEEKALFPFLNPHRSMMLMEVEHDDLRATEQLLRDTWQVCLQEGSSALPLLRERFHQWKTLLEGHIREEDSGILPLVDKYLSDDEKGQVAAKLNDERMAKLRTEGVPSLERPEYKAHFHEFNVLSPMAPNIAFTPMFDRDRATVQRLWLKEGAALKSHWAPQHQWLVVLSGQAKFSGQYMARTLGPGDSVTIDSRYWFSLQALTDVMLLSVKVWPYPHYLEKHDNPEQHTV